MQLSKVQQKIVRKQKILVGLCIMKRKIKAKRNQQIYARLKCQQIQTVQMWPFFEKHWSKWPVVDVLFQYHTGGFPYIMVTQYVNHYKPYMINDLENQQLLWDRNVTYSILRQLNVLIPEYLSLCRDAKYVDKMQEDCFGTIYNKEDKAITYQQYMKKEKNPPKLFREIYERQEIPFTQGTSITEQGDLLIVRSQGKQQKIKKPFVQKPSDSNNHQVAVYYPSFLGGGRRIIYRQDQGNFSTAESQYQQQQNSIRRDQSYLYEEFVPKSMYDIKVYLIGEFIFAQSRRTPIVAVEKSIKSSQLRQQVQLTEYEKQICFKIAKRLKFSICALDILRSSQKSYVCDINGWAFAKADGLKQNVCHYWDIVSDILRSFIFKKFFPEKFIDIDYKSYGEYMRKRQLQQIVSISPIIKNLQLRAVISIYSNGTANDQKTQNQLSQESKQNYVKIGQVMRKNNYDGCCPLEMHSVFQHEIQAFTQQEGNNTMLAGYFLKGFLGIRQQLSPALIQMVNVVYLNPEDENQPKFKRILRKIISDVESLLCTQHNIRNPLQTYLYFQPQAIVNQILNFIKQNSSKLISSDNIDHQSNQNRQSLEQLKTLGHVDFKLYETCNNEISHFNLYDKWYVQLAVIPSFDNQNVVRLPKISWSRFKQIYGCDNL